MIPVRDVSMDSTKCDALDCLHPDFVLWLRHDGKQTKPQHVTTAILVRGQRADFVSAAIGDRRASGNMECRPRRIIVLPDPVTALVVFKIHQRPA